jgi:carboxylesterase type B
MFNLAAQIALCCLVASSVLAAEHIAVGQAVNTTSGTIVGHASKLDPSVSEYLGIPYGAPPVGDLRFMPPQSVAKSKQPIIAAKFSPDCPQTGLFAGVISGNSSSTLNSLPPASLLNMLDLMSNMGDSGKYSEDCLTLNVWTKPQTGEKKKAVLLWIFGGGFSSGSPTSLFTNGVHFAGDQDVVLVSIK